jgi:acyl carrier protein
MGEKEILSELELIIEADPASLQSNAELAELDRWDSIAVVSFMAIADEKFGVILSAKELEKATTVADLINLVKKDSK